MTALRPVVQHVPTTANLDETFCSRLASRLQALRPCRRASKRVFAPISRASKERLEASLDDVPLDTDQLASLSRGAQEKQKTVLYLAYGSNLCNETFLGKRAIRPLSQINVMVPSLRLTFDLPGIPYSEPCFANTALRSPDALDHDDDDYHKNRWHKGLIGVVYEVTLSDYAHIIATEGGGSSYKDILVRLSRPTRRGYSSIKAIFISVQSTHSLCSAPRPPGPRLCPAFSPLSEAHHRWCCRT